MHGQIVGSRKIALLFTANDLNHIKSVFDVAVEFWKAASLSAGLKFAAWF